MQRCVAPAAECIQRRKLQIYQYFKITSHKKRKSYFNVQLIFLTPKVFGKIFWCSTEHDFLALFGTQKREKFYKVEAKNLFQKLNSKSIFGCLFRGIIFQEKHIKIVPKNTDSNTQLQFSWKKEKTFRCSRNSCSMNRKIVH